ncbi:hypothetical protein RUM44_001871 [Polyplax serrata]|uniref:Uncharacterized protein n=1 Tax=Polyplax serrata TaxID=468196 RepID=A0ABR1AL99_POLSC
MGTVGSYPGSARTSAECSLASSRESSTTSVPYKVVMLGSAGVGKSSLISQFMTSEYLHAYDTSLAQYIKCFRCKLFKSDAFSFHKNFKFSGERPNLTPTVPQRSSLGLSKFGLQSSPFLSFHNPQGVVLKDN